MHELQQRTQFLLEVKDYRIASALDPRFKALTFLTGTNTLLFKLRSCNFLNDNYLESNRRTTLAELQALFDEKKQANDAQWVKLFILYHILTYFIFFNRLME